MHYPSNNTTRQCNLLVLEIKKSIFRKSAKTTSTSKLLRQSRRRRRRLLPAISFEFSTCENRNGGVTSTVRMWIVRTEFTFILSQLNGSKCSINHRNASKGYFTLIMEHFNGRM